MKTITATVKRLWKRWNWIHRQSSSQLVLWTEKATNRSHAVKSLADWSLSWKNIRTIVYYLKLFRITWNTPHSLHAEWSFWTSFSWESGYTSLFISIKGTRRAGSDVEATTILSTSSLTYLGGTLSSPWIASSWTLGTGRDHFRFSGTKAISQTLDRKIGNTEITVHPKTFITCPWLTPWPHVKAS